MRGIFLSQRFLRRGCNDPQAGRGGYHCCGSFRFAEILPEKVTLLAEIAEWPNEIDKARAEAAKARAEERLANRTEAIDVKRAEFALRKALVRIDIAR